MLQASPALQVTVADCVRRHRRAARLGRRRHRLPPRPRPVPGPPVPRPEHEPRRVDGARRRRSTSAELALAEPGDERHQRAARKFWDAWSDARPTNPTERGRQAGARADGADAGRRAPRRRARRLAAAQEHAPRPVRRRSPAPAARSSRSPTSSPSSTRRSSSRSGGDVSPTTCSTAATCCSTSSRRSARSRSTDLGERLDQRLLRRRATRHGVPARDRPTADWPAAGRRLDPGRPARRPAGRSASPAARSTATCAHARRDRPAASPTRSTRAYGTRRSSPGTPARRDDRRSPRPRPTRSAPAPAPAPPATTTSRSAIAALRGSAADRRRLPGLRRQVGSDAQRANAQQANAPGRSPTRSTTAARASPASRMDEEMTNIDPLPARLPGVGARDVDDGRDARHADQPTGRVGL